MGWLSLKWRIVAIVAIVLTVGVGVIVAVIAINYSKSMTDAVYERMEATAYQYANRVKADLEMSLGGVKSLKSVIAGDVGTSRADRRRFVDSIKSVTGENGRLFAAWCAFEPNAFDGRDAEFVNQAPLHDATGRYVPYLYMTADNSVAETSLTDYDKPGSGDYYLVPLERKRDTMVPPYMYEAGGVSQYICSVVVPILHDNTAVGVVGGDVLLQPMCDFLRSVTLFQSGFLVLLDQNGNIAYHPEQTSWMKPADSIFTANAAGKARQVGQDGTPAVFEEYDSGGTPHMYAACPVEIGDTGERWVMIGVVPTTEAMASVRYGVALTILIGVIVLVVSLAVLYILVASVTRILTNINKHISETSASVADASVTLASASGSLAEGATVQAASLEETSSALEEMASMTRQNADNATRTNQTNIENNRLIAEGAVAVRNMSEAMDSINDSAEKIGRIIKTIEEIAFQTNLLALNAAVEAARAGEAGKGFAVVADEVRNLAGRSAQAAKDTSELISGTIDRVHNGTGIATRLADSFKEIEDGAGTVGKLIAEIASATNEQAQGVDQVNTSIAKMDEVTQQNAASAEETAAATETLNGQSEKLDSLVDELTLLIAARRRAKIQRQAQMKRTKMLPYIPKPL